GLRERDRQVAVEVLADAGEALVGRHPHVHVEVAGGPAPNAGRAPTAEAQRGPGVHAGGDVDGVGAVLDAAPLAAAVVAGLADQLPLAAAAGAHGVRDHLAEE